jgi:hypothetical protein
MMTPKELSEYTQSKFGVPFNTNRDLSTHNLQTGFDCFTWAAHIYSFYGRELPDAAEPLSKMKELRRYFEIKEKSEFLDWALFYGNMLDRRHIAVMLDDRLATHCSLSSNGVAILDIRRKPWCNTFKGFYHYR